MQTAQAQGRAWEIVMDIREKCMVRQLISSLDFVTVATFGFNPQPDRVPQPLKDLTCKVNVSVLCTRKKKMIKVGRLHSSLARD